MKSYCYARNIFHLLVTVQISLFLQLYTSHCLKKTAVACSDRQKVAYIVLFPNKEVHLRVKQRHVALYTVCQVIFFRVKTWR